MTTQTAQQTKSNEIIINREVVSFSCWYYKVTKNGETLGKFETREQAEKFVSTL